MKSKFFASLMVMMVLSAVTAFAQVQVSGVVNDNIGPAIGVSVVEQGTTNGTYTDMDGKFALSVKSGATLVFSYIGFKDQVIPIGSQTVFNVTLEEDQALLEEVVVVGYGLQKKKLVTGSTIQVKGDELVKMNTTSPLAALQSSTPGMQIVPTSGQPGEGFKVTIRGIGTTGSYAPLYVIDGVTGGDINALNPSDIESIDVLKDAASCAIYGARGANGVVLVTTKQAKAGKYTVTYDGFYGWQNSPRTPELLNAKQYMDVENMVTVNNGGAPIDWESILEPKLYKSIMDGSYEGTDWLKAIHNDNAPYTNHAVNVVGGTEVSKFSMGVSYTGQEGIYGYPVQSNYNRITARINSDHVLWKKNDLEIVTVGENVTFTYSTKQGIGTGNQYWNDISNMLRANPIVPIYDENGDYAAYDWLQNSGLWSLNSYTNNPVYSMVNSSRGNNRSINYNLNASLHLIVQPIKNLTWRSQINYKMSANTYRQYSNIYKNTNYDFSDTDIVSQSASAGWSWSWENTINYKLNTQDHHFDFLVGNTLEKNGLGESVGAGNSGGKWPNDWTHAYVGNMTGTPTISDISGSTWGDSGLVSFFGRVNWDYKEKYMASVIFRADGSSNFARGHRWGYFPSVSAGWVLTNEDWARNLKGLSFLKIRGSWGQNGNCSVDNFQYLATVAIGSLDGGYAFGNGALTSWNTGSYADKLANEDITWETSEQLDLGLDARFFNDRLTLTFDWYQKDTKNWLVNAPVMGHFGADAPYINGGDVRNQGVELALGWSDSIGKDFSYSVSVNGAYNRNEVTRIANDEGIIHGPGSVVQGIDEIFRAQVGYPIGYFWGYQTDGVFQNQAEIDEWVASGKPTMSSEPMPGDLKFVDLNEDGVLNSDDKTQIGDPNPDFTAGLNFSIFYKGFDLGITGYGAFGQQIFKSYRRYSDSQWDNYTTDVYSYWHGEGTSNKYPRLTSGTNYNFMNNSDLFIENGDYFKIQNITIGYDFARLFKSGKVGKMRIYVQGQNLFTFTGYSGMDPEIGSDGGTSYGWAKGIDLGYYPAARTILVGLNLKF